MQPNEVDERIDRSTIHLPVRRELRGIVNYAGLEYLPDYVMDGGR